MAKREYTGSPLDFTMKSIGDKNGTTEGGTTEDDNHEQNTEILPDYVDAGNLTDNHWKVINWFLASANQDDPEYTSIADEVGLNTETVKKYVHKFFPSSREIGDLSAGKQLSVAILSHHGVDLDLKELSENYPVSRSSLSYVKNVYPDLIQKYSEKFDEQMLDNAVEQYKQTRSYKAATNRNRSQSDKKNSTTVNSKKVQELYENGYDIAEISDELDAPVNTIGAIIGGMKSNGYFDDPTDFETESVAERIPDGVLTVSDSKVWEKLKEVDNSDVVAEELGISVTSVEKVRQLASAFYQPGEVEFSIPEKPRWESNSQLKRAVEHPQSRDVEIESMPETNSEAEITESNEDSVSDKTLEILGRYYNLDQNIDQISEEMGVSNSTVRGSLSAKTYTDQSDWITPESDNHANKRSDLDDGETPAGKSDQESRSNGITTVSLDDMKDYVDSLDKSNSEYIRDLIRAEKENRISLPEHDRDGNVVNLDLCDCETPRLSVESATVGPTRIQSLFCSSCEKEFTTLQSNNQ